jgi:hypothetical protein
MQEVKQFVIRAFTFNRDSLGQGSHRSCFLFAKVVFSRTHEILGANNLNFEFLCFFFYSFDYDCEHVSFLDLSDFRFKLQFLISGFPVVLPTAVSFTNFFKA